MPPQDQNLPEGTDSIIEGMSSLGGSTGGTSGGLGGGLGGGSGMGGSGGGDFGGSGMAGGGSAAGGGAMGGASGGGATGAGGILDVQSLKSQATDKVRDAATQGKDRAAEALDSVSRLVTETADTVDERLGPQYGDYVRRAAGAIDGLNESIRTKQVDELLDDARNLVRKSPAVAIGAAAAIGFVLVRLVKSGMPQTTGEDDYGAPYSTGAGVPPRIENNYDPVA